MYPCKSCVSYSFCSSLWSGSPIQHARMDTDHCAERGQLSCCRVIRSSLNVAQNRRRKWSQRFVYLQCTGGQGQVVNLALAGLESSITHLLQRLMEAPVPGMPWIQGQRLDEHPS